MPGHYVPGGGVSCAATQMWSDATRADAGRAEALKWLNSLEPRPEPPLICFLGAAMVLIKGVKKFKKKKKMVMEKKIYILLHLLFILNHGRHKSGAFAALKDNCHRRKYCEELKN